MAFENDPTLDAWIGKGLVFPIQLENGKAVISSGFSMIEHSLNNILSWVMGTRFMLGEFGSLLNRLVQSPNDQVLWGLARTYIIGAINKWEKRVTLLEVNFNITSDTSLDIELKYKLTNTQLEQTYIYPFYTIITT